MLTLEELKHAIVIDFEGLEADPLVLCGALIDGEFCQVVFDQRLASAARAKNLAIVDAALWLDQLVQRASVEDRLIVAFSNHEKKMIERHTDWELGDRYMNVLPLLKQWRRKVHPDEHARVLAKRRRLRNQGKRVDGAGNTLLDFARLAGIRPPHGYGKGRTTNRIKHVRDQLKRRGSYEKLTPTAKGKCTNLLKHNEFDVCGLYELLCRVLDGLVRVRRRR